MTTAPHRSPAAGLALAVAALAACGPTAKPEPALTLAELKSADLQTEYVSGGVVRLTDGEYREPAAPGAASTTVVTLTGPVAYAPLVSGQPAAAAIVESGRAPTVTRSRNARTALSGVASTGMPVTTLATGAARAMLNCASAITSTSRTPAAAAAINRSCSTP